MTEKYPIGIVYGAMHESGRWYIGSSIETLACRRFQHYAGAFSPAKSATKFMDALRETEEKDWIWGVHEEFHDVTIPDLRHIEDSYQTAFRSVEDGFNTIRAVSHGKPKGQPAGREARKKYALKRRKNPLQRQKDKAMRKAWYDKNRESILLQKKRQRLSLGKQSAVNEDSGQDIVQ